MYIKITNGTPEVYSIRQLRADNKDVSFPQNIPDNLLAEYGVYPVTELSKPSFDSDTHYLQQSDFYQVGGQWQVHYTSEPLPESQVAETIRLKRNSLLSETDYIVVVSYERKVDVPVEWQTYRQALRDITTQEGFPWDIVWPVKP